MARRILVLGALAWLVLASFATSAPAVQATALVHISGFAFNPQVTDVRVGDTVTWDNQDSATHTVTAGDGSFNSGNLVHSATFSRTFNAVGTFAYHCNIHGSMTGKIRVSAVGALPDLTVTAMALPQGAPATIPGLQQVVSMTMKNAGDATAAASTLQLSYRYHGTLHGIASFSVPDLGPGEGASFSTTWDTKLKVGDFVLVAAADNGGAVPEANEANNALEALASVLLPGVPGIDLLEPL